VEGKRAPYWGFREASSNQARIYANQRQRTKVARGASGQIEAVHDHEAPQRENALPYEGGMPGPVFLRVNIGCGGFGLLLFLCGLGGGAAAGNAGIGTAGRGAANPCTAAGLSPAAACPPRIASSRSRDASSIRVNSLGPAGRDAAGAEPGANSFIAAGAPPIGGVPQFGGRTAAGAASGAESSEAKVRVHTPGPSPAAGLAGGTNAGAAGIVEGSSSI